MKDKQAAAGGPKRIGSLVSQLLSRRGYAQVLIGEELQTLLAAEVGGDLAGSVRAGNVKRGVLHVYLADSVTHQELAFRKRAILKRLQSALPSGGIRDIRFHISAAAQEE